MLKFFAFLIPLIILGFGLWWQAGFVFESQDRDLDEAVPPSSVLFVGDMMFDRSIRKIAEENSADYSYLFSCVKDLLLGQTIVVGNLEGPITNNESVSVGSKVGVPDNFQFTFAPEITDALLLHNIGYVNIGNNHILNFGSEGLEETKKYLDRAGIRYFGDDLVTSIDLPQRKITLINYNEFSKTPMPSIEGDYIVVYAHWGDEYVAANAKQRELAHKFIDAGADIVIGSHPHVVQEMEMYNGRPIFYSLGNFIFDQWFSPEVMHGQGVRLTFNNEIDDLLIETIDFNLSRDGRTCPVTSL